MNRNNKKKNKRDNIQSECEDKLENAEQAEQARNETDWRRKQPILLVVSPTEQTIWLTVCFVPLRLLLSGNVKVALDELQQKSAAEMTFIIIVKTETSSILMMMMMMILKASAEREPKGICCWSFACGSIMAMIVVVLACLCWVYWSLPVVEMRCLVWTCIVNYGEYYHWDVLSRGARYHG